MNLKEIHARRRFLQKDNANYGEDFVMLLDNGSWPITNPKPIAVFRNRRFLVQEFSEKDGNIRLSVNRTEIQDDGNWLDGITWDELQHIKDCCGYSERMAVEIYPPAKDLVNVSNIRHLWVLSQSLPFQWKAGVLPLSP